MKRASRLICGLLVPVIVLAGCAESGEKNASSDAGEPPKRAPRMATLYVESKGEPLNAGGKKVEKSDEAGSSAGAFSAKDLLVPGMFVLVSGATALGGPLLIKALDKKDKPSGPTYAASGGDDGTFVPVESSASGSGPGPGSSSPGSGGAGGTDPAASAAPDPGSAVAVARDGAAASGKALASGHGVVSTPTSVLLSMGYATDFAGPSYISGVLTPGGVVDTHVYEVHVYKWTLTVEKAATGRGGRVDVYASFSGLPADAVVGLVLDIIGAAIFTCDHTPQVPRLTRAGLGDEWLFRPAWTVHGSTAVAVDGKVRYYLAFRLKTPGVPIRIGYLTVEEESEILGDSFAEVTVH